MKHAALISLAPFLAAFLASCAAPARAPSAVTMQDLFFTRLSALCGQTLTGQVVSTDAQDAAMRQEELVLEISDCRRDEIRMPLGVGDDRSRTWIVRRGGGALQLVHDHRKEDGSAANITGYGGITRQAGLPGRQEFPVDATSQQLFRSYGLDSSTTNVWALEIEPGHIFAYELRRPDRYFRAEFDLASPLNSGQKKPAPEGAGF